MSKESEKQRIVYQYATSIGLIVLSACSVTLSVLLAVRHNDRLPWMVAVSLLLLFLTAINGIRIRSTYDSMKKNYRLRRKAHATRGVILHFPDPPNPENAPQENPEEAE